MIRTEIIRLNHGLGADVRDGQRGMVILENSSHLNGGREERGRYRLTKRTTKGSTLWHVMPDGVEVD